MCSIKQGCKTRKKDMEFRKQEIQQREKKGLPRMSAEEIPERYLHISRKLCVGIGTKEQRAPPGILPQNRIKA